VAALRAATYFLGFDLVDLGVFSAIGAENS
jgi:hypothetical protein